MIALLFALLLPVATPPLPSGLVLCAPGADMRAALPGAKELSDDMWEAPLKLAGRDGFATAILDGGKLVELRLRFYETPGTWELLLADLQRDWGEPTALRPHTAEDPRGKAQWSVDGVQLELKASQEQFFVRYAVAYTSCQATPAAPAATATPTPTGALEAWDPYTADPNAPVVPDDKKKAEEARKAAEAEAKKKAEQDAPDDKDIDW